MKPTITFRPIRPDSYAVERGTERLGTLYQTPQYAERNAGMWRFWPHRQDPTPWFRTLEEAKEAITDMHPEPKDY